MRCLPIAGAIVIAASAATALAVPGARAEGTGVIAAGPGAGLAAGSGAGTGAADRAAVAAALVAAIGARERVVGDAVAEARGAVAAGTVPAVALASFRRVRDRIDDGWRAFQRVQIDVAQDRLAEARAAAEALVALPGGPELYADAALRLGAVLQYRRNPDAPGLLALALALDPERPITLAEFSPDVVEAIDAVRAAPAVPARIHVAARPAGAIVSVDGKELGAAPLDAEVARGQHLVVARAPLHRAAVRAVAVDGAASVELALESDDAAVRLAGGAEPGLAPAAEQALVDAALALADLDDVVVAAVTDRRGGPALAVQRCAGAPARCTAVVEIGAGDRAGLPAAAREAWRAVQGGALRDPPGVLGDVRRPPPPSGCELCRNPLVWTGVGAVVIGAVIVFAVTSGARPPPVVTIDGHDFGH
ncbi:MAG TPA: PEGA domain-containing protein [Kofleriaceae bacterium]